MYVVFDIQSQMVVLTPLQLVCGAATWIQAAYHTITAVVGAGVLGLPHAFSFLGWGVGIVVLAIAGLSALFTGSLLATMHEHNGVRHNRCVLTPCS